MYLRNRDARSFRAESPRRVYEHCTRRRARDWVHVFVLEDCSGLDMTRSFLKDPLLNHDVMSPPQNARRSRSVCVSTSDEPLTDMVRLNRTESSRTQYEYLERESRKREYALAIIVPRS